jgi:hypothetical protein
VKYQWNLPNLRHFLQNFMSKARNRIGELSATRLLKKDLEGYQHIGSTVLQPPHRHSRRTGRKKFWYSAKNCKFSLIYTYRMRFTPTSANQVMMSSTNESTVHNSCAKDQPTHAKQEKITDEQLTQLVKKTCQHPRGSIQRRQGMTQLIQAIIESGKLWREDTPYYEDALQQTWLYLCRNLCQANTGAQYDPAKSSVTTWLNHYLRRRLEDFRLWEQQENKWRVIQRLQEDNKTIDPTNNLPAPPDIPPMLEETRQWLETDPSGELRRIHIKGRPDITCQVLMLRRLPPETSWETLSAEFNCSASTLANFYQRQCIQSLRRFGESQGYL